MTIQVYPEPSTGGDETYSISYAARVFSNISENDDVTTVGTTLIPLTTAATVSTGVYKVEQTNTLGGFAIRNAPNDYTTISPTSSGITKISTTGALYAFANTNWAVNGGTPLTSTGRLGSPAYNGGYVLIPSSPVAAGQPVAKVSITTNGVSWTDVNPATLQDGTGPFAYSTNYINGRWIVSNSQNYNTYSTDLINWTTGSQVTGSALISIASNSTNRLNGVNNLTPPSIWTTTDGINWTSRNSALTEAARRVRYANNIWYCLGENNQYSTSTNGTAWTLQTGVYPATDDITDVAYGNGYYVMVTEHGNVNWSTNGFNWSTSGNLSRNSDVTGRNFYVSIFNKGRFIIAGRDQSTAGNSNKVFTSTDAQNWTDITSATSSGPNTTSNTITQAIAIPTTDAAYENYPWMLWLQVAINTGSSHTWNSAGASRLISSKTIKGGTREVMNAATIVKVADLYLNYTTTQP